MCLPSECACVIGLAQLNHSLKLRDCCFQTAAAHLNGRAPQAAGVTMQDGRGDNRDKIFLKGKEQIAKAKELDNANSGDEPSLIMREKQFTWPFPLGFLNTMKEDVRVFECFFFFPFCIRL